MGVRPVVGRYGMIQDDHVGNRHPRTMPRPRLLDSSSLGSARAAIGIAVLAGVLPSMALLGYATGIPALSSLHPEHAAMSPVTALALLLTAAGLIVTAQPKARSGAILSLAALAVAAGPLLSQLVYGDDRISPLVLQWMRGEALRSARMSFGTSLGVMSVAVAYLPSVSRRPHLPDVLCGFALLVSGIAILGYAYGTLDLYGLAVFKTMSLRSAATIFLLGLSAITLHSQNGWFALLISDNEAGSATRRQLLLALTGPLLGWLVLHFYRDARLGVGASLAIFVAITAVPLVWLVLRDGRLLSDFIQLRRLQQETAALHTADLERQLAQQASLLERQSAERIRLVREAKAHSDYRYRALFQTIDTGFCIIEVVFDPGGAVLDYVFLETNEAFESQTGLRGANGRSMRELAPGHEQHWFDFYGDIVTTQQSRRFESRAEALGDRWYDVHAFPLDDARLRRVGILFNDITEQRRAALALQQANSTLEERVAIAIEEREQAQAALRQSQKMEAVGQLTGGLAHDFNNLLQGITGSLELLNARIALGRFDDAGRYVTAAQGAARRAAALTHRLLAFSRRQTLAPKTTDVNRLVAGMEELVRRTVGPHIAVETVAAAGLWNTLVDQSQLENALLNLCINARDAMPDGGRLVIETANKWLDQQAAAARELPPGQFVTLSVSDDGCGMSAEIIARAFDPFFTTKPLGMGTGLGLSMIYGFAKQSGGQVRIHSEVGRGTVVSIWLPRHEGAAQETVATVGWTQAPQASRGETVLVVDDEPTVRVLVVEVLDDLGYTAIEAADGSTALQLLESDARIDLLITDVGLPGGVNGRQVADAARVARPDLTVLFITGYAENAVLSHGHLPEGMHVLTKPFRMEAIAARIQELMADRMSVP